MKDNYTKSEIQEMRLAIIKNDLPTLVELMTGVKFDEPEKKKEPETVEPWSVWKWKNETVVFIPTANSTNLTGFYIDNGQFSNLLSSTRFENGSPEKHFDELKGHKLIGHATPSFTITPV